MPMKKKHKEAPIENGRDKKNIKEHPLVILATVKSCWSGLVRHINTLKLKLSALEELFRSGHRH
jgi:hypothetical protein